MPCKNVKVHVTILPFLLLFFIFFLYSSLIFQLFIPLLSYPPIISLVSLSYFLSCSFARHLTTKPHHGPPPYASEAAILRTRPMPVVAALWTTTHTHDICIALCDENNFVGADDEFLYDSIVIKYKAKNFHSNIFH